MKKQSKTFELIEETPQEQTPRFVATYEGELEIPMDDATIARLEAEKAAALAGLHVPPHTPWRKPVEQQPVEEVIAVAETVAPVEATELRAAKDAVTRLQQEHEEATRTAELVFKTKLTEAVTTLGDLERRAAIAIDQATSSRLKDVLASLDDSDVAEGVRAARVDAGTARQEALRKRAAPYLKSAAEARALLKEFDRTFSADLEAIGSIPRVEWLLGTPSTSPGAHVAAGLYTAIENGLKSIQQVRESLVLTLSLDAPQIRNGELAGGFIPEIERLLKSAANGWSQEEEGRFVWAATRLATASPDAVTNLQLVVRGVIGAAARLRDMKSVVNTERPSTIRPLPDVDGASTEQKVAMGVLPSMAASYSPFGKKEA